MKGLKTLAVNIRILLDNDEACKEYDHMIDTVTTDIPIFVSAVCGINNIKIGRSIDVSGDSVAAILSYSDYQIIRAVKKMIDKGTLVVRPICGAFKITTISADLKDPFTMKDIENYIREEAEYLIPFAFEGGKADRNGHSITKECWNKWILQYQSSKSRTQFTILDDTDELRKEHLRLCLPTSVYHPINAEYYKFGEVSELMDDCAIIDFQVKYSGSNIIDTIISMVENGDAYLGKIYLATADDKAFHNLLTVYLSDKNGNAIEYKDILEYSEKQKKDSNKGYKLELNVDTNESKKEAIENYHLFDKYLGDKFEAKGAGSIDYFRRSLNSFRKLRNKDVRDLKTIIRFRKYGVESLGGDDYISHMGLQYLCNTIVGDRFISPLINIDKYISPINDDYVKARIRSLELRIAFLNKNIKMMKRIIRERCEAETIESTKEPILIKINLPRNVDAKKSVLNIIKYEKEERMKYTERTTLDISKPIYLKPNGYKDDICGFLSTRLPVKEVDGEVYARVYFKDEYAKLATYPSLSIDAYDIIIEPFTNLDNATIKGILGKLVLRIDKYEQR